MELWSAGFQPALWAAAFQAAGKMPAIHNAGETPALHRISAMKEILIRMEEKSYAIDSSSVLEIVPLVQLEPVDKQSAYIAGQMRYRGQILPVLDLCALLLGRTHQKKFSTRILIVQLETQTVGLIAESLTDLNSENSSTSQQLDLKVLAALCL